MPKVNDDPSIWDGYCPICGSAGCRGECATYDISVSLLNKAKEHIKKWRKSAKR